jgi:RNA recognition motif-containing protein
MFVRNLPPDVRNEELYELVPNKDSVKQIRVVRNRDTANLCRGYAYVDFSDAEQCLLCVNAWQEE